MENWKEDFQKKVTVTETMDAEGNDITDEFDEFIGQLLKSQKDIADDHFANQIADIKKKVKEELIEEIMKQTNIGIPGALSCDNGCHYTKKYGFVPEAGCQEHD